MATVNPSQSNANDTIEAADINTPINQLAAVINGGIDSANLADNGVTTAKHADDSVTAAKMQYGMVRNRQGGTAGTGSWFTRGTTNTDTSATGVFIQCGSVAVTAVDMSVTFPVPFSQVPVVVATVSSASGNNTFAIVNGATATNFLVRTISDGGAGVATEGVTWIAIGQ